MIFANRLANILTDRLKVRLSYQFDIPRKSPHGDSEIWEDIIFVDQIFFYSTDSSTPLPKEEDELREWIKWRPLVVDCVYLLDDWKRWPKDETLPQVCLYSLPSIFRLLSILVGHVEKLPYSLVIFLSIRPLFIKEHK